MRDRCLTVAEAADWLGVNHKLVRRLIADGTIRAMKVGRVWRIDPEALQAALAATGGITDSSPSVETSTAPRPRPVRGEFARKARER